MVLTMHEMSWFAEESQHGNGRISQYRVGGLPAGTKFAEALGLFAIAASLGSTESLVVPPAMQQPRDLTSTQRTWSAITPGTVRLSIGVEDPEDLVADLEQALARSQT